MNFLYSYLKLPKGLNDTIDLNEVNFSFQKRNSNSNNKIIFRTKLLKNGETTKYIMTKKEIEGDKNERTKKKEGQLKDNTRAPQQAVETVNTMKL